MPKQNSRGGKDYGDENDEEMALAKNPVNENLMEDEDEDPMEDNSLEGDEEEETL